ncbi:MAG: polysaccharide biosynthesis/export family protein [Thermoanaerobaculia bacterium]
MKALFVRSLALVLFAVPFASQSAAQQASAPGPPANGSAAVPAGAPLPPGYVIGAEDMLSIVFWREKDMSADVVVRPDGKISLPLLNDIDAAGYTPEQLRAQIVKAASKYIEEPNATVVVKEIHSRKVFVTGQVSKPGTYPLVGDMNMLQLIAHVGGLLEYADAKNIVIVRKENGQERRFKFNYKDVVKGKNVQQNITLRPGDTIVVP